MNKYIWLLLFFPLVSSGQQQGEQGRSVNLSIINNIYDDSIEAFNEMANFNQLIGRIYPPNPIGDDPLNPDPIGISGEFRYIPIANVGGRGRGDFNDIVAEWFASADVASDLVESVSTLTGLVGFGAEINSVIEIYEKSDLASNIVDLIRISDAVPEDAKRFAKAAKSVIFAAWSYSADLVENDGSGNTAQYIRTYKSLLENNECIVVLALGSGALMYDRIVSELSSSIKFTGQLSVVKLDAWKVSSIPNISSNIIGTYIHNNGGDGRLGELLKQQIDSARSACSDFKVTNIIADDDNIVVDTDIRFNGDGTPYDLDIYWEGDPEFPVSVYFHIEKPDCEIGAEGYNGCGLLGTVENPSNPISLSLICQGYFLVAARNIYSYYFLRDANGVISNAVYNEHLCGL